MQKKNETTASNPQPTKKLELNVKVKVLEPKTAPHPVEGGDPGGGFGGAVSPVIGYS